jgi:hypothetical protein
MVICLALAKAMDIIDCNRLRFQNFEIFLIGRHLPFMFLPGKALLPAESLILSEVFCLGFCMHLFISASHNYTSLNYESQLLGPEFSFDLVLGAINSIPIIAQSFSPVIKRSFRMFIISIGTSTSERDSYSDTKKSKMSKNRK